MNTSYSTLWVSVSTQQLDKLVASANSFHRALSIACEKLPISWDDLDDALSAQEQHVSVDSAEGKLNIYWRR